MTENSSSWTRLSFSPSTGRISVEGDVYSVLGIGAEDIADSRDPLSVLPGSVARSLIEGEGISRDGELSLVIIPGDTRHANSVTIIRERTPEFDIVADIASGVASFGPDGTILSWNKRMSFLFGPGERDVKGRKAEDVLPAPVLYNWTSVLSSVYMGHEVKIEFRPSGDKKVEGILSRGGPGVIGLFFDSTENYNTGKRLRALNRLNQAYIQSTETGLILLDSRLRILLSNSSFALICGEKGSLIGLQLRDVLPEESYRWVHDASERLFGEERSEQTAVVPFRRSNGEQLVIKHTLRAVLNEMNQAVNFVCLFEDRTAITNLRQEADNLRKSLTGIAGITDGMINSGGNGLCERIQDITGSSAVARYMFNPSETLELKESHGSWPSGVRRDEPGDLGFPAYVWRGDDVFRIEGSELGYLSGHFRKCIILPLGRGVLNKGFVLLCDPSEAGSDQAVLDLVVALIQLRSKTLSANEVTSRERSSSREEAVQTHLLGNIPFPVAIFRRSGELQYLNGAMEELTGLNHQLFNNMDLAALIDPEGHGHTLDSLASAEISPTGTESMIWRVVRRDGSQSGLYQWNVSIVEDPWIFKGDYGFLVTALPTAEYQKPAGISAPGSMPVEMLRSFIGIVTLQSDSEIFRAVSDLCLENSSSGIIEFHRNGETVASFSKNGRDSASAGWNTGPLLLLGGREFETRVTSGINIALLEPICETISSLRGTLIMKPAFSDPAIALAGDVQNLVGYLENFCVESVRQTSAVLNLVESTDTFSGFARTILYSGETAARAAELLKAAISVSRENFRIVSLERFLSGFHSSFTERGLRPPSLSIEDRLPEVMIIPRTVLQAVSILCQSRSCDTVVTFSASSLERDGEIIASLTISGLAEAFTREDIDEGIKNLADGVFDSSAEIAFIVQILSASGCRINMLKENSFSLVFSPAPAR